MLFGSNYDRPQWEFPKILTGPKAAPSSTFFAPIANTVKPCNIYYMKNISILSFIFLGCNSALGFQEQTIPSPFDEKCQGDIMCLIEQPLPGLNEDTINQLTPEQKDKMRSAMKAFRDKLIEKHQKAANTDKQD